MDDIILGSAVRTPIGSFEGVLASLPAPRLGSLVIAEAIRRAGIGPGQVDEVYMGNVVSAGMGYAPARQAAIFAGLPNSVGATTINKVCGSSMKAVILAAQAIRTGDAQVIVAGGMESMSQTPYLLDKARTGYRMGHGQVIDSMIRDGLWEVFNDCHVGVCCEIFADRYQISREEQDRYAIQSYTRALDAQREGRFKAELISVQVQGHRGETLLVEEDEEPGRVQFDKIPLLAPAFKEGGTITVANASSVNDGAAAVTVLSGTRAAELGIKPLARIVGYAQAALAPESFTIAPAEAIKNVLKKTGLTLEDIDLFEINEAYAVVSLTNMQILGLTEDRVNLNGGAVALGHPLGATGARILTTLLYLMEEREARRGLCALCLGGGEAIALIVEKG
ncbi:MAG: acetyl-CoA C-acyltransferase [candidate division NC10 bacterium]|nr:acetyl-CoA C-acyltransferase [candidate division NC10 bacterium]MCH7897527.1 acetyl-CoA C-acyltransferase [candidate division NC10 bacterium]MCZ6551139.1 acetyl-CoA C-acyltransferase [candidate division NC10 bacterium]